MIEFMLCINIKHYNKTVDRLTFYRNAFACISGGGLNVDDIYYAWLRIKYNGKSFFGIAGEDLRPYDIVCIRGDGKIYKAT